jgi:hypothetical protein
MLTSILDRAEVVSQQAADKKLNAIEERKSWMNFGYKIS